MQSGWPCSIFHKKELCAVALKKLVFFPKLFRRKGKIAQLNACPCSGMALQKSPEAFRFIWNVLNQAKRPAGDGLNVEVIGEIINALVLFPDKETFIFA